MENENLEFLKRNVGIILSYGEDSSMMPVGTFRVNDFIDTSKKPYESGMSDLNNTVVELVREKSGTNVGDSDDRIFIPLKSMINIYPSNISQKNKEHLHATFGIEAYIESLNGLEVSLANKLKENPEPIMTAEYKTLDDLEATYVSDGIVMGSNYSVMPYSLGMVLRKQLKKTPHYEDKDKDYTRTRHR